MQGFSVESETSGISSLSTSWQDLEAGTSQAMKWTWLQEPKDQAREDDKLRGPSQKSAKSCETRSFVQFGDKLTTRAHMQKGEGSRRLGKQHRVKEATNWAEMGPGQSAQAGRPYPFWGQVGPPFDLDASQAIYSPLTESHTSINSSSAAEEQRSLRGTISKMRVVLVV
jgi:hypothetical protein